MLLPMFIMADVIAIRVFVLFEADVITSIDKADGNNISHNKHRQ